MGSMGGGGEESLHKLESIVSLGLSVHTQVWKGTGECGGKMCALDGHLVNLLMLTKVNAFQKQVQNVVIFLVV